MAATPPVLPSDAVTPRISSDESRALDGQDVTPRRSGRSSGSRQERTQSKVKVQALQLLMVVAHRNLVSKALLLSLPSLQKQLQKLGHRQHLLGFGPLVQSGMNLLTCLKCG